MSEIQSKKTTSAFLNELQNLLQWFTPDMEVNNLLSGKEGGEQGGEGWERGKDV